MFNRSNYNKEYYKKNKEKEQNRYKEWAASNKEKRHKIDKRYSDNNKDKIKERHIMWYKKNKTKSKDADLKYSFGITFDDYNEKLRLQNGVCEICKGLETHTYKGTVKCLAVDHNHETGQVRGLLCHKCNILVGSIERDKGLVLKAIKYLDKCNSNQQQLRTAGKEETA